MNRSPGKGPPRTFLLPSAIADAGAAGFHFTGEGLGMGTWGAKAFDNDSANDWAYGLEDINDLSPVETVLDEVIATGEDYLDSDIAVEALAACEVLARLRGNPGYTNPFTEKVDLWAASHKDQLVPSQELLERATAAIDRILDEDSELRELWEEGDAGEWVAAVEDLRRRMLA